MVRRGLMLLDCHLQAGEKDGCYFTMHMMAIAVLHLTYDDFKIELGQMNYKIPDIDFNIHQHFSVCVSEHNWWAVGYDNVSTNPKSTYYRSY